MNPGNQEKEGKRDLPSAKRAAISPTTLVLLGIIGLLSFLLILPSRKRGFETGRVTHAAAETDAGSNLPAERPENVLRSVAGAVTSKPTRSLPIPPPGGVDAFGLPANGAFETGSARSGDHPLSLSSLAPYLPIWGYLEGQEVIVGGRVYRAGEPLVIRTPAGLCKARVAQIDRHCLVLRDEEGTEVRIPWPGPSSGSGTPANEVFVDPSSPEP
ncbi:MAG: hypothetical protein AB7T14_09435 [Candidatus Methylacidiphilaceae bacterium]